MSLVCNSMNPSCCDLSTQTQFHADPFQTCPTNHLLLANPELLQVLASNRPKADMFEDSTHYKVLVDLPGMSREHVKIEVRDGKLLVFGERNPDSDKEFRFETARYCRERPVGQVRRSFNLPGDADQSKVDAKLVDGILHIDIEKMTGAANKLVQIK